MLAYNKSIIRDLTIVYEVVERGLKYTNPTDHDNSWAHDRDGKIRVPVIKPRFKYASNIRKRRTAQ